MKKTVISILLLLPFLLIVIISFAGRIYGTLQFVEVEEVYFLNDNEDRIYDQDTIIKTINVNDTYNLKWTVLPNLATNKTVRFTSEDESVFTVDENGLITALSIGIKRVTITTIDQGKTASVLVKVSDECVSSVSLNYTSITLGLHGSANLVANIYPHTAIDKEMSFQVSDRSVISVTQNSSLFKITANSVGTATITISTHDGNKTAQCEVNVVEDDGFAISNNYFVVQEREINLQDYIDISQDNIDNINIVYQSGEESSLEGMTLLLNDNYSSASIKVYLNNEDVNYKEIYFIRFWED